MKKELKEKWKKALRSGRYKQCQKALYKNGAYCCLGVLAKVCRREIISVNANGELTKEFREEIGMTDTLHENCYTWNDEDKLSFIEIAKRIR